MKATWEQTRNLPTSKGRMVEVLENKIAGSGGWTNALICREWLTRQEGGPSNCTGSVNAMAETARGWRPLSVSIIKWKLRLEIFNGYCITFFHLHGCGNAATWPSAFHLPNDRFSLALSLSHSVCFCWMMGYFISFWFLLIPISINSLEVWNIDPYIIVKMLLSQLFFTLLCVQVESPEFCSSYLKNFLKGVSW